MDDEQFKNVARAISEAIWYEFGGDASGLSKSSLIRRDIEMAHKIVHFVLDLEWSDFYANP